MIKTIRGKLFLRIILVFVLVLLLVATGQVASLIQKRSVERIVLKHKEISAVQEYQYALLQLLFPLNQYIENKESGSLKLYDQLYDVSGEKFMNCLGVIESKYESGLHSVSYRIHKNNLNFKEHISDKVSQGDNTHIYFIIDQIKYEVATIDVFLCEMKSDIIDDIAIMNTSYKHSSITVLGLGVSTILIIVIGGFFFSQKITNPIKEMVRFTKKIKQDKLDSRLSITTNDEIDILANSFNSMLDHLETTTVSRNYYDNIISSMFNSLIVTDKRGCIKSINKSAIKLTGYSKDKLVHLRLEDIIPGFIPYGISADVFFSNLDNLKNILNKEYQCFTINGEKIPILLSCSILSDAQGKYNGLVVVISDLTEKKVIEAKVEQIRKMYLIAINDAQEEEKYRIARDLHDGLGQHLTGISFFIQNYFVDHYSNDKEYQDNLDKLQGLIDSAIIEAKTISRNLMPMVLKDFGLKVALQNLVDQFNKTSHIHFKFNAFNYDRRIDEKLEKALYRICQESINNIIKHAKATEACIQLLLNKNLVVVMIDDNGVGFDYQKLKNSQREGIGLHSIKERVNTFNGALYISSDKDNGTEILIEIPINY